MLLVFVINNFGLVGVKAHPSRNLPWPLVASSGLTSVQVLTSHDLTHGQAAVQYIRPFGSIHLPLHEMYFSDKLFVSSAAGLFCGQRNEEMYIFLEVFAK
jgi:hypothetical protein